MSNGNSGNNNNDAPLGLRFLALIENTINLYERIRSCNRQISDLIDENERLTQNLERAEADRANNDVDAEQLRAIRGRIEELERNLEAERTRATILQGRNEDVEAELGRKVFFHLKFQSFAHMQENQLNAERVRSTMMEGRVHILEEEIRSLRAVGFTLKISHSFTFHKEI